MPQVSLCRLCAPPGTYRQIPPNWQEICCRRQSFSLARHVYVPENDFSYLTSASMVAKVNFVLIWPCLPSQRSHIICLDVARQSADTGKNGEVWYGYLYSLQQSLDPYLAFDTFNCATSWLLMRGCWLFGILYFRPSTCWAWAIYIRITILKLQVKNGRGRWSFTPTRHRTIHTLELLREPSH